MSTIELPSEKFVKNYHNSEKFFLFISYNKDNEKKHKQTLSQLSVYEPLRDQRH